MHAIRLKGSFFGPGVGMPLRRVAVIISTLGVFALSVPNARSQDAAWAGVVAAAKKEGKVVLYTATPLVESVVAAGFRKKYPEISLEILRGASGQQLAKVEQERSAGVDGADALISVEIAWFLERAKEGKLLKPSGPGLAGWPSRYLREGAVVITGAEPLPIVYNKNLVKIPPKVYADLLKPEYKGKLGTSELVSTTQIAWYDWLEKTQGADFLVKLKEQNPKLYNGGVPTAQAVGAGEILASPFMTLSGAKTAMAQGSPIEVVLPNPSLGFEFGMAAFGWSKRPNAALVLEDYVMSTEGQVGWHGRGDGASARPNIPGALQISTITVFDSNAYPPEVVKRYTEHWNKIFK